MLKTVQNGKDLYVYGLSPFKMADTFDCGQAFRWSRNGDGSYSGIAMGKKLSLFQTDDSVVFKNTTISDFEATWREYFDCDRDYNQIIDALSVNPTLKKAAEFSGGIRLLRQDGWESLCSFILSQNNNIPRIKGIISRLCEHFGEDLGGAYGFPTAERLSALSADDLAPIRSGFRAKYILDAAHKVASGKMDFDLLRRADIEQAREHLQTIKGVGPKVADCVLLFGFSRIECFPVDVWIGRAMQAMFCGEIPPCALPYAGIAQQYIFHYVRMTDMKFSYK